MNPPAPCLHRDIEPSLLALQSKTRRQAVFLPRDAPSTLLLSVRLSVSVTLRYRAHIGWVTSKLITRIIRLEYEYSLF